MRSQTKLNPVPGPKVKPRNMRATRRFTQSAIVAIVGLACASSLAQQPAAVAPTASRPVRSIDKLEQVTDRLQRMVPDLMQQADVPGLSIALIQKGEVVWHHGFGVKDSKTKEPVSDTTVFEAASLS